MSSADILAEVENLVASSSEPDSAPAKQVLAESREEQKQEQPPEELDVLPKWDALSEYLEGAVSMLDKLIEDQVQLRDLFRTMHSTLVAEKAKEPASEEVEVEWQDKPVEPSSDVEGVVVYAGKTTVVLPGSPTEIDNRPSEEKAKEAPLTVPPTTAFVFGPTDLTSDWRVSSEEKSPTDKPPQAHKAGTGPTDHPATPPQTAPEPIQTKRRSRRLGGKFEELRGRFFDSLRDDAEHALDPEE